MSLARPLDVAIIGLACRFPGARDASTYWENSVAARDCTGDVPVDRWDPRVFFDPASGDNDRVYCKRGGYLDAPIVFDPTAYGVMPLAVSGGEPEQFLVLDTAHAALADAGYPDGVDVGRKVDVVIGRGNYFNRGNLTRLQHGRIVAQTLAILRQIHPDWSSEDVEEVRADLKKSLPPFEPGTIAAQITNGTAERIVSRLDLNGASFVVDAASASSLVALELGARALVDRRADLALVGGVYLQADVDFPMVFCRLGALSRRGQARPFARDADGTLPGEGVGMVVLKRLADAEREGDRIYAVVKGVGVASDGRGRGLAAPSARGHARAMRLAYRRAGIDPSTVGYIEGHGLGVPASDRAELRALRAVFPSRGDGEPACALGASGALIGHAMPAAGMAGLIKAALVLHHRVIPPTPHAGDPHPLLADVDCPFTLPATVRPWIHGGRDEPRRAGVNAFGFGGINSHAILEEHSDSADRLTPGCQLRWENEAVLLSATDRDGLIARARALLSWLDHEPNRRVTLKDLAFTINTQPSNGPCRLGLVVESTDELGERLRGVLEKLSNPACRAIRDGRGSYFWERPLGGPGAVAFVFAGEGAQYPGMLADLCRHFPEVRARFDIADRVARREGHRHVPSEPLFGGSKDSSRDVDLWSIGTAVNVVLSAHWALRSLLTHLEITPDRVLGHSSGEILALAAAGVLHIDGAFSDRIAELGTLFERLEETGRVPHAALVAVAADRTRVEAACGEIGGGLTVALDNCPHQVIVAGTEAATSSLVGTLRAQGVLCEALPFARAYHTAAFEEALGPIREFFEALPMSRPSVPIDSCATAGPMPDDVDGVRRLAVEQWARPVAFRDTIEAMYASGVRVFVEIGARGNLTGCIEDTLRGRPHFAVTPCLPRRSGLTQLNHLVASLFAQGVSLRPDYLYARRRPSRIELDRPMPVPQAPELAVGFPEMCLSAALAERLRGREAVPTSSVDVLEHAHANGRNGHAGVAHSASANGHIPPRPSDPRPALIKAHLRTMDEFLDTQRQVMDAYLALRRRPSLNPSNNGHGTAVEVIPTQPGMAINKAVQAVEVERAPTRSAERILLDQVSRRTGYPRVMLKLDLDMEADLGIDSIKRVEIFGELRGEGIVPDGVDLDRLSECRTLGQVLALLETGPGDKLASSSDVFPGPWVGKVAVLEPGRALVAVRRLDLKDDPVAAEHTLGGRRVSALDPTRLGLPVLPFTVMTEMLAQAASLLVPGRVVVGLRDIHAHRWIRYEEEPVALEIRASLEPGLPDEVRVAIYNRGPFDSYRTGAGPWSGTASKGDVPVVEGRVMFADHRVPGPVVPPWVQEEPRECRFDALEIYRDQWLFHGAAFQALSGIGPMSPRGIKGTLRVLPRTTLFRADERAELVTDPIVLDAITHLYGCWALDEFRDAGGDVIFPLRLAHLEIFDGDPGDGADVACRIRVREVQHHCVRVDADLIAPDGRLWMRVTGWDNWRFYWPGRYRDHLRMPDRVFVSETLALGRRTTAEAAWLEPPADFGKPIWRDVLEALDLGPEERASCRALGGTEERVSLRLWGRVAAKEVARRIGAAQGEAPVYPADLRIVPDDRGRPWLRSLLAPERTDLPAVSIAHTRGVAVALASPDPDARVGIDVELIADRSQEFERIAFDAGERAWLDRLADMEPGSSRAEWAGRIWCGKEAVAKATGLGLLGGPGAVSVVDVDARTGALAVVLGPELAAACPDLGNRRLRAFTARRGDYVWAWTLAERID